MDRDRPKLNDAEARVLGVLIEKSTTTPNAYPLSLNALANGSNQKSNRDPVTSFVEAEVVVALQGLMPKGLAGRVMEAGSRVEKFRHTARATLGVTDGSLAVLAELLLRGPQSPGLLRARVHRMSPTPTLEDLKIHLDELEAAKYVSRISPAPGSRSERYVQLLSPDLHPLDAGAPEAPGMAASSSATAAPGPTLIDERVDRLERQVAEMKGKLDALIEQLGA